ncbi:MAG: TetR/AcrR family transcriptional regulator [Desulfobacter sp.]|nr:TetR/AcrR family transcriptional regulator [Desulfobacter sp.]WDP87698.1 MAG: TetR/AcrR family transcriptional regulator [Desulfobacter sp.]
MAKTAKGTGKNNRQKILDTAMAMIGKKGIDNTSLAQISKASGLSKGTLYYYYASKNDLIFDIADIHMERITATLFHMIDTTSQVTWEKLLTAFFTTLLTSETRSRLHLYLVREAVSGNEELKLIFQSTYAQWFSMVDDAYDKMAGPKIDVAAKAKLLVAVVDGFILQTLLGADKTQIKDIVRLMLKVIVE